MSKVNNLRSASELRISNDHRMPQANLTNANHLTGDVFGDSFEDDDDDFFGDIDNPYGDVDTLSPYSLISGDVEIGDARRYRGLKAAGIAGASAVTAALVAKEIRRRRAMKRMVNAKLRRNVGRNNSKLTSYAQRSLGKIALTDDVKFFLVNGGKMNSSPLVPSSSFPAEMLKYNLDRQNSDTPFFQETTALTYSAGTWSGSTVGTAEDRYYPCIFLQIGTNMLNAAPGTIVRVEVNSMPLFIGAPLSITSTPFLITYDKGFYATLVIFPWRLVANKPMYTLGKYSASDPITVTVSGIPQESSVNLVVPGSEHPWTIAMRNSLARR